MGMLVRGTKDAWSTTKPSALPTALLAAALAIVLASGYVALVAPEAEAADCTGTTPSLQSKINAAPAGGTVTAAPCVYREQVSITKPLTLVGQSGSEIRGSDVWRSWERLSSGLWRSNTTLPPFPQQDVSCHGADRSCAWPEQVFRAGVALKQVAPEAALKSGQFKVDTSRRVVVANDPTTATTEVSVRRHWITGGPNADGVTIRGFTMKHAATDWRCGAIQSRAPSYYNANGDYARCTFNEDGGDWNVRNSVLSDAHGAILGLRATGVDITGNTILRGGQIGILNPRDNSRITNNKINNNNAQRFCTVLSVCQSYDTNGDGTVDPSFTEAGGIKVAGGNGTLYGALTADITVSGNEIGNNFGNGLWFDLLISDITVSNNAVHHNYRRGIFVEISDRATVEYNRVWENGWGTPQQPGGGAGITVANSDDAQVIGNKLAWNADGIFVLCEDRPVTNPNVDPTEVRRCERNTTRDNAVAQEETPWVSNDAYPGFASAWTGSGGSGSLYNSTYGNGGSGNDYYYSHAEDGHKRFEWNGTKYSSLAQFNATPAEEGGRYMTATEMRALPLPDAPQSR